MSSSLKSRYFRQEILPGFGVEAQAKLKASKVFIVGAGGLGSPAALYLAAAGVGHLIICDFDRVELSNLNRQILHAGSDLGKLKAESALQSLTDLNDEIKIECHSENLNEQNISRLAAGADIMLDCLDNISTRLLLNTWSIKKNIPIVHGGVEGWTGQISFLHPPLTPCMSCLFEDVEDRQDPAPVLGAVAGIVGAAQALEAIKYLTGTADVQKNTLLFFDGFLMEWTRVEARKKPECKACS